MNSDHRLKLQNAAAPGKRALASAAATRGLPLDHGLALDTEIRKTASPARSPDPYNSSGSFDRKKNWERVGKR